MTLTHGSVEIVGSEAGTSDGLVVHTPNIDDLPTALKTLRGLTGFSVVDPIPTEEREVGKFTYRRINDDEFERVFTIELVDVPIADAMWEAQAANGDAVTVLFRERRTMTPDEVAAALALADVQEQRRATER